MNDKIEWWGYIHTDGSLHAKRYFDALDTKEGRESPFVKRVFGPIEGTWDDIINMMKKKE